MAKQKEKIITFLAYPKFLYIEYREKIEFLKLQDRRDEFMKVAREEIEYLEKEKPYEGWELSVKQVKNAMTNYNKE